MNLLRRAKLHSGNDRKPDCLTDPYRRLTVAAGVVIGQRNDVEPENLCHIHKVIRCHIRVTTRGKARMSVKIVIKLHFKSTVR